VRLAAHGRRLLWHAAEVASPSAGVAAERPFYDRHADAYDALISDPVEPWVEAVDESLRPLDSVPHRCWMLVVAQGATLLH
jgi:hypothetical protein